MKVLMVVPSIYNQNAGPSHSVPALCKGLWSAGVYVELHTQVRLTDDRRPYPAYAHPRSKFPHFSLGRSPEMMRALTEGCRTANIIHANGNWMMPHAYMDWARKGTKCKLVFSPRGSFSATAQGRSRLKKAIVNAMGVRKAISHVDMFHATSEKEYEEIRALGYKAPVVVLPIGLDIPEVAHASYDRPNKKLIFLGRLHETKAVDHLLLAWEMVCRDHENWSLEIAGPDYGAEEKLRRMVLDLNLPRVTFVGEKVSEEKYDYYSSADLYALPSLTENFGITIAEALACGTPVVASKGCPWPGLVNKQCGWWHDIGTKPLADALSMAMSASSETLNTMGDNGRKWILEEYSCDGVGRHLKKAYEWLVNGGELPDCVRV